MKESLEKGSGEIPKDTKGVILRYAHLAFAFKNRSRLTPVPERPSTPAKATRTRTSLRCALARTRRRPLCTSQSRGAREGIQTIVSRCSPWWMTAALLARSRWLLDSASIMRWRKDNRTVESLKRSQESFHKTEK